MSLLWSAKEPQYIYTFLFLRDVKLGLKICTIGDLRLHASTRSCNSGTWVPHDLQFKTQISKTRRFQCVPNIIGTFVQVLAYVQYNERIFGALSSCH